MNELILASSSIYRKELLSRLQVPFKTFSPHLDESRHDNEPVTVMVQRLAREKAQAAAQQFPKHLCIGSDTTACLGNITIGKPLTHEVATQQLKQLSGQRVDFHTGVSVVSKALSFEATRLVTTTVTFRELTDDMIEHYLRKEKPYFSSASFKSETLGSALITRFEGDDPTALIGLPLIALCDLLILAKMPVV